MTLRFSLALSAHIQCIFLDQVGDLGFANELGNYVEYSGAPNEDEVLQYARVVIDVRTLSLLALYTESRDNYMLLS